MPHITAAEWDASRHPFSGKLKLPNTSSLNYAFQCRRFQVDLGIMNVSYQRSTTPCNMHVMQCRHRCSSKEETYSRQSQDEEVEAISLYLFSRIPCVMQNEVNYRESKAVKANLEINIVSGAM